MEVESEDFCIFTLDFHTFLFQRSHTALNIKNRKRKNTASRDLIGKPTVSDGQTICQWNKNELESTYLNSPSIFAIIL